MTPDEYITLAGKYCERMEWNHDAIPELASLLEVHDARVNRAEYRKLINELEKLQDALAPFGLFASALDGLDPMKKVRVVGNQAINVSAFRNAAEALGLNSELPNV